MTVQTARTCCTTNSTLHHQLLLKILHITQTRTTAVSLLQVMTVGDSHGARMNIVWSVSQVSYRSSKYNVIMITVLPMAETICYALNGFRIFIRPPDVYVCQGVKFCYCIFVYRTLCTSNVYRRFGRRLNFILFYFILFYFILFYFYSGMSHISSYYTGQTVSECSFQEASISTVA